MGLFGKSVQKSPKDQVKEWSSKLRHEKNMLERQIRSIEREEEKVKRSLKEAAKRGDRDVCLVLAKELVRSRQAKNRIHTSKTQLNSVMLSMTQQVANLKLAGSIQKSTEVMKAMSHLVRVPEVARTMQELSKEMMKAGIIEEMMEESLDMVQDDAEELEDEAQREVDKIISEVTAGALVNAPTAVSDTPAAADQVSDQEVEEEEEETLVKMRERLEALRS